MLGKLLIIHCFIDKIDKIDVQIHSLTRMFDWVKTEAVVRRCSAKQVFLKISQILQENLCAGVFF